MKTREENVGNKKFIQKVGKTPVIPVAVKIIVIFILLLLISNFTTNYINIMLNRRETVRLTNELMVKELKDIFINAGNQYEIFRFSGDRGSALSALASGAESSLSYPNSLAFGVTAAGGLVFQAANGAPLPSFSDRGALQKMTDAREQGVNEGSVIFDSPSGEYMGVYKFHDNWDCFLVRADLVSDLTESSDRIFTRISVIIICITVIFMIVGLLMLTNIFRFMKKITAGLFEMQASQTLGAIGLENAPNDDITYLGASFNTLSSTINNLLSIFRKFVSEDMVSKAYRDHIVRLEGTQRELTVLFSDICGFTYMTETLGNDIINLLNVHYDQTIRVIHEQHGIIGSIIGDALLAVFGTLEEESCKSLEAVDAAWKIIDVVTSLREKMIRRKELIEQTRTLTDSEERVFRAVLLEVGVGVDGGTVFYGNIGSSVHMTNTVIGDRVNSASRLEGLTRVYHLPVLVSVYVKEEIEKVSQRYHFIEIDVVQVKGKKEGIQIFHPLEKDRYTDDQAASFGLFSRALEAYYRGDWDEAKVLFAECPLKVAGVFLERMGQSRAPADWSGIWTMTAK